MINPYLKGGNTKEPYYAIADWHPELKEWSYRGEDCNVRDISEARRIPLEEVDYAGWPFEGKGCSDGKNIYYIQLWEFTEYSMLVKVFPGRGVAHENQVIMDEALSSGEFLDRGVQLKLMGIRVRGYDAMVLSEVGIY